MKKWLIGEKSEKGEERICPERHVTQAEWCPSFTKDLRSKKKRRYDYISDYECPFPHPIKMKKLWKKGVCQTQWNALQKAKQQGYGIPIEELAHFTSENISNSIIEDGGFRGQEKKINMKRKRDVIANLSWWRPVFPDDVPEKLRDHLSKHLSKFADTGVDNFDDIRSQFAKSQVFRPEKRGHIECYFQFSIPSILRHYRNYIGLENDLEFSILGTFLYEKEIMHAVLVWSKGIEGHEQFSRYPVIPEEESIITRDDNGRWMWYPQATTRKKIKRFKRFSKTDEDDVKHALWENVAFAFYLRPNDVFKIDLNGQLCTL